MEAAEPSGPAPDDPELARVVEMRPEVAAEAKHAIGQILRKHE
jgi:hypothetical protein